MNITAGELGSAAGEMAEALCGAFFQKIFQAADDEWVFKLRKGADTFYLAISVSPENSRAHLLSGQPPETVELHPFARLLRKLVSRSYVTSVSQVPGDRILKMDFHAASGPVSLVAELFGPAGNLYLLDGEGKTLAIALPRKSRNTAGRPYIAPSPPSAAGDEAPPVFAARGRFPANAALEERYGPLAEKERLERAKTRALAPLRAELKKIKKRRAELEREREELSKFADDKRLGDILQASFHLIKKGENRVEARDVFSTEGELITIALDPSLAPAENVRRYYKRYKRFEKGLPRIGDELSNLTGREGEIKAKMARIEAAGSAGRIEKTGPAAKKPAPKEKKEKAKQVSGPRRFVTSDGHMALVGRSGEENDEITFRIANGRDLWLHARDYPGSHVVVRLPKGAAAPERTLREAAMLALHYSKAAKAGRGEVTYCSVKDVRKPKGAPPGKVLVTGAKSVMVKIDPDAVAAMRERASQG